MDVFSCGHCAALFVVSVNQLSGESLGDGLSFFASGGLDYPAKSEGLLSPGANLHGDLIAGASNAFASDLEERLDVIDGGLEDLEERGVLEFSGDNIHSLVKGTLCDAFFPLPHHAVDELCDELAIEPRVGF